MGMFEKIVQIYEFVSETNDEPREEPGMDRTEIERRLKAEGIPLHPLLLDLYSWRNGIWHINGFLHLLSLDYALARFRSINKYPEDGNDDLFPVLDLNGNVLFCVDLKTEALFEIDPEADRKECLADNAGQYLDAILEVLRNGSATYDEVGGLFEVTNDAGWEAARSRHSIQSAWW